MTQHDFRVAGKIDRDLSDLSDRPTEVQRSPKMQYARMPALGRETLTFPRFLAGYSEAELEARALASWAPAYDWRAR